MDIYVARQPIFDRKMNLYGYELLYRENDTNKFTGSSDRQATASLLANSVLVIGFDELTDGTRGFINFPADFLVQELPRLLPKKKIIVEILERVESSREVIQACRSLKEDGYVLALDDFIFGREGYEELIELADMIKVEFSRTNIREQLRLIRKYRGKKIFLAEKVENMKDYRFALAMGYDLFQGYFFSRPLMVNAKEIGFQKPILVRALKLLRQPDPDMDELTRLIGTDLGLTYQLLSVANTIQYGALYPIRSVRQALARIGAKEVRQWIHIMMIKGVERNENSELVKRSLIRGKMLELLAQRIKEIEDTSDFFITGIFSSLDQLLNQPMNDIMRKLPLDQPVKDALSGRQNELKNYLDAVIHFERAEWGPVHAFIEKNRLTDDTFMNLYFQSIKWQNHMAKSDGSSTFSE